MPGPNFVAFTGHLTLLRNYSLCCLRVEAPPSSVADPRTRQTHVSPAPGLSAAGA